MFLISEKEKQVDLCEFQVGVVYIVSFGPARYIDPISENEMMSLF